MANQPGHESYGYGWPTAQITENQRYQISTINSLRYAVWRVGRALHGLMGWTAGFLYNAEASLNFADAQSWFFAVAGPRRLAIVLQSLGDPRRVVIAAARVREPEIGISTFPRNYWGVAVQPGDIVQFSPPSCLAGKVRPTILSIVSFNPANNVVVVEVDCDVSNALHSTDRNGPETLELGTCRTWRESGSPENWDRIVPATPFRGRQRRVRIEAASIAANGRVSLTRSDGQPCAIVVPRLANPATNAAQSFRIRAVESDGSVTDLTASVLAGSMRSWRIKTTTNSAGNSETVLCLGTKDHLDQTVFSDLRTNRLAFIVDFVAEATASEISAGNFELWGFDRCRYSVRDWSGTVGNFRSNASSGTGGGWYCTKAVQVTRTPIFKDGIQVGETDSFTPIEAGSRFPTSGKCAQCGTCAGFAPLEYSEEAGHKPFGVARLGRIMREIWNGVSVRWDQLMPGLANFRNVVVKRPADGHTSLSELAGMPQLSSWPGMFARRDFPRNRAVVADCTTVEKETGTRLVPVRGAWWNIDHAFPIGYEYGQQANFPAAGHYGAQVSGWATVRDPIDGELSDAKDLSRSYRSQLPRQDSRVVRDSGEVENAGLANWGRSNVTDSFLLAPRIPKRVGVHDREDCIVTIHAEPVPVEGLADFRAKMTVQVRPVRTFRKTEQEIVTASIQSATMDGDECIIEISPTYDQWSFVTGPPRFRYDEIRKVLVGGNFCDAPDWEQNLDNYANRKTLGAQHRAKRGDYVGFGGFPGLRFPILTARAHGGGAAARWGDDQRIVQGRLSGYFEGATANLQIGSDPVTGTPLYGLLAVRHEYRAPDAPTSSATTIRMVLQGSTSGRSLLVGARLRNSVTGEMMTVTGASFTANSPEVTITATRGTFGTAAAAISATDPIYWETVTNSSTGSRWFHRAETQRPTLGSNEYWQDPASGAIVFGSGNANVTVQYAVIGDTAAPSTSRAFSETFEIPTHAQLPTGLTWTQWTGQTTEQQSGWVGTPGAGTPTVVNVGDNAVLQTGIANAALVARVSFTLDGPAEQPGRWGHASGGTQNAKRRDKIRILDNQARQLAAIVSQLPGMSIQCFVNSGVFLDDLTDGHSVEWTEYRVDDWQAVSGTIKADGGRGLVWLDQAAFDSIDADLFCLKVN